MLSFCILLNKVTQQTNTSLFNKIQNDNITVEQAKLEKSLLESILKFYETTILSDKINVLETSLKDK